MKNKGFTLVELIAVIAILTVIITIFVPTLLNSISSKKEDALNNVYNLIESAARNYVTDYNIETPTKIELSDLCDRYIDCPVINPKTEEELTGYIFVGKDYYYSESNEVVFSINDDLGVVSQSFNSTYEPGTVIELQSVSKESYSYVGWEVVEGNSVIKDNKLTIGTTKTIIKPKLVRYLNNYMKYLYDNETTRTSNGLIEDPTTDKNIRYAGSNPNNYVYFNCTDKDSNNVSYGQNNYNYASSCEVWRIIGVFEVDNGSGKIEKRVKLVRDAFAKTDGTLIGMSWDSSADNGGIDNNSGYGINQWGESTYEDGTIYEGSDLMRFLNGYYIGKDTTCVFCNTTNQGICSVGCTDRVTPLSKTSLSMVEDTLWKTGTIYWQNPLSLFTVYESERKSKNEKLCKETSTHDGIYVCTDKVINLATWIGMVGLIYPSDYGYASTDATCAKNMINGNSTCENDNWLQKKYWYWTLSNFEEYTSSSKVWYINNGISANHIAWNGGVRPSLYLSSNVYIIGGDGGSTPYKLSNK